MAVEIKDINTEKIRLVLAGRQRASASEIARKTALSFPTVTRLLQQLCQAGEAMVLPERDATGGRRATMYALNPDYSLYLLVAVEGVAIRWSVRNIHAKAVDSGNVQVANNMLRALDELMAASLATHPSIRAVVVGLAAMVDKGKVEKNVWDELNDVDLDAHFASTVPVPVRVENSMNLVALGQWHDSPHRASSSVCVYLGQNHSFGAGLILKGEIWRGAKGLAGELEMLPNLKAMWKEGTPGKAGVVAFYCAIIQIYVALLSPDRFILYQNPYVADCMADIRHACRKALSEEMLPHIELSDDFAKHYDTGMFHLASSKTDKPHDA